MRISDWSSDVCSSDLSRELPAGADGLGHDEILRNVLGRDGSISARRNGCLRLGLRRQANSKFDLQRVFSKQRSTLDVRVARSEEHTSELQSLMRISYAVFCLKKKKKNHQHTNKSQ